MTILTETDRRAIATSLDAHAFMRRSEWRYGGRGGHREWLHFFVHTGGLDLIVNISVVDDLRPARLPGMERIRVVALVRSGGEWAGDIDDLDPSEVELSAGRFNARFGQTMLALADGRMTLQGGLRSGAVTFSLELEARSFPSLASDVAVGAGSSINWLVVPQLRASGTVTVEGVTHRIGGAVAYHDRNWGPFAHHHFTWQWAHAQASDAGSHSVVFARLLDGTGGEAFLQTLFVWEGPRLVRMFRGRDIDVRPEGFLSPAKVFTLPRLASLMATGASEVPRRLVIEARFGADVLRGALEVEDLACLVLPDDERLHTTLLYETLGHLHLRGQLAGRPVEVDARAVFETMRRAS